MIVFEKRSKLVGNKKEEKRATDFGPTTLKQDTARLVIKLVVIALVIGAVFTWIFGIFRYADLGMKPGMKDGDLLIVYRVDKGYAAGDVTVFDYHGQTLAGRIVAVAGDTVDITSEGLLVNGARQQEDGVVGQTDRYEGGPAFPLVVAEGQIFVLGDNRGQSTDSRIIGCLNARDTFGKVIGLIRRRNI